MPMMAGQPLQLVLWHAKCDGKADGDRKAATEPMQPEDKPASVPIRSRGSQ